MTLHSLQALTWGTVTGAVVSALLLASGESAWPESSRWRRTEAPPIANPPIPAQRNEAPNRRDQAHRPATTPPASR